MAGVNIAVAISGAEDVLKNLKTIQSQLTGTGESAEKAAPGVGILHSALGRFLTITGGIYIAKKAMDEFVFSVAKTGEELLALSKKTGISVEQLSVLKYAAEQSETNLDSLTLGLKLLSQKMLDASSGAGDSAATFTALGIAVKDSTGNLRPMNDVMLDVADVFNELPDGATKSALAVKLFGRSGTELIPLLNEGSTGISKMTDTAKSLGLQMSEESAKAADKFGDNLKTLKGNLTGLEQTVGNFVIPILDKLIERFNADIKEGGLIKALMGLMPLTAIVKALMGVTDAATASSESLSVATAHVALSSEQAKSFTEEETKALQKKIETQLNADATEKASAEKAKKTLEESKSAYEELTQKLKMVLEDKQIIADFDEVYFSTFSTLLSMQGMTQAEVQTRMGVEVSKRVESSKKFEIDYSNWQKQDLLEILGAQEATDAQRIEAAKALSRILGKIYDDRTKDEKDSLSKQKDAQAVYQDFVETAARGVGDALKSIWMGNSQTWEDVWHRSLNTFVDVMIQMEIQATLTASVISVEMASATAGISLVAGILGMLLGGSKHSGKSELDIAEQRYAESLQQFIDDTEDAIGQINEGMLSDPVKLQNIKKQGQEAKEILDKIFADYDAEHKRFIDSRSSWTHGPWPELPFEPSLFKQDIIDNEAILKDAITQRYELEKTMIGSIMDMLESQAAFAKNLDQNITDVQRALMSPDEAFQATLGDISGLKQIVATTTGDAKLSALSDLQQAYNDLWSQAQGMYANDPNALASWQSFVIGGLKEVKDIGMAAYDKMIDLALVQLDLSQAQLDALLASKDLSSDLNSLVYDMGLAASDSLALLEDIATADPDELAALAEELSGRLAVLGFAKGGVGDFGSGTLAVLHGKEAIIPLENGRIPGGASGGGTYISVNGPAIFDEISMTRFSRKIGQQLRREQMRYG